MIDLEEFRKLDQGSAFHKASSYLNVPVEVLDGIWATESGRGSNMLSHAGAEGHFQIMPKTRGTWEERVGSSLDPYNFNDALYLATLTLKENMNRFGNIGDALKAYNGGWDKRNWNNSETKAYTQKVFDSAGMGRDVFQEVSHAWDSTDYSLQGQTGYELDPSAKATAGKGAGGLAVAEARTGFQHSFTPQEKEAQRKARIVEEIHGVSGRESDILAGQLQGNIETTLAYNNRDRLDLETSFWSDLDMITYEYDRQLRTDGINKDAGFKGLLGVAVSQNLAWKAYREHKLLQGNFVDPEFDMNDPSTYTLVTGGDVLNKNENKFIMRATNAETAKDMMREIRSGRTDMRELSRSGFWGNLTAGLVAGSTDPVDIAVTIGSMGMGRVAFGLRHGSRAGRSAGLAKALRESDRIAKTAKYGELGMAGYQLGSTTAGGMLYDYVYTKTGIEQEYDIGSSFVTNLALSSMLTAPSLTYNSVVNARATGKRLMDFEDRHAKQYLDMARDELGADATTRQVRNRAEEIIRGDQEHYKDLSAMLSNDDVVTNQRLQEAINNRFEPKKGALDNDVVEKLVASAEEYKLIDLADPSVVAKIEENYSSKLEELGLDRDSKEGEQLWNNAILNAGIEQIHTKAEQMYAGRRANVELPDAVTFDKLSNWFLSVGHNLSKVDHPTFQMVADLVSGVPAKGGDKVPNVVTDQALMANHIMRDVRRVSDIARDRWLAEEKGIGTGRKLFNFLFQKGTLWDEFDTQVFNYIQDRQGGRILNSRHKYSKYVQAVGNEYMGAFHRAGQIGIRSRILGWEALAKSDTFQSGSYMPHKYDPEIISTMSSKDFKSWADAYGGQLYEMWGGDELAEMWVSQLIDNIASRAEKEYQGRFEAGNVVDSKKDMIHLQDHLKSIGVDIDLSALDLGKFEQLLQVSRGGKGFTKKRLNIDWNKTWVDEQGVERKLHHILAKDMDSLLENYTMQMSTEASLAKRGIVGNVGIDILRRALAGAEKDGKKVAPRETLQTFNTFIDQLHGQVKGQRLQWMRTLQSFTNALLMGGLGWTQSAEAVNVMFNMGAKDFFNTAKKIPQLTHDIAKMRRGETVKGLLPDIEKYLGEDYGVTGMNRAQMYRRHDLRETADKQAVSLIGKAVHMANYGQGFLSGFNYIHGTLRRMSADGIIRKALRYAKEGKTTDKTMNNFGFTKEVMSSLAEYYDAIVSKDAEGNIIGANLDNWKDHARANQFLQAIQRGVNNMIQEPFIGEAGKYIHNDVARLFTQLRNYGIVSLEKQIGRNINNRGIAQSLGMFAGMFAVSSAIHLARINTNMIGMDSRDRREYAEFMLDPANFGRGVLNYMSMSGLLGDVMDIINIAFRGTPLGFSDGRRREGIQDIVPAFSSANKVLDAVQNKDLNSVLKAMPLQNVLFMTILSNYVQEE